MVDYSEKLGQFKTFKEKLDFTTKYLLASRHVEGEKDYSFEEAMHIARLKLGEESKKLKDGLRDETRERLRKDSPQTVNPNARYEEDDYTNQYFFGKPESYMVSHAFRIDDQMVLNNDFTNDRYIDLIDNGLHQKIKDIEKNSNALDIRFRMEERIGSREDFNQAYNITKPNLFSRMFNTSSRAYHNLDETYKAFNNPKHALYGDLNSLERATNQYLEHKIPGWKAGDPIPEDIYTRFKPKDIARIRFCGNINACIKEQRENTVGFKEMVEACEQQNFKDKKLDLPPEPVFQQEFQNQLANDLNNEEIVNNNDAPEMENPAEEKELDNSNDEMNLSD